MTDTEDAYRFEFTSIDGDSLPLDAWRGRPVLVVNTASYCGYTPQYGELQALWQRYRRRGLVVLGVPSNDFGGQEPGSAAEIKQFCAAGYAVDFPLGTPRWNFHKYLVGPDGQLVGTWPSQVGPTDGRITSEIERLLPQPV
jgi:glutathione peroxidase